jgi:hypothetical protein
MTPALASLRVIQAGNEAPRSGRRKTIEKAVAVIPWRWPEQGGKAQYDAFDNWHDVAMQIVHRARASFRLMAVYKRVIRWKSGEIWSSDAELASMAGRCNWKTISREIALHRKLGIILVTHGSREANGRKLKTRTIRLAVPTVIDPAIVARDRADHTVTRGPSDI